MKIILLAAGKGTRMNMDIPKVLAPFNNKTLIECALDTILASGVDQNPIVVTGYKKEELENTIKHYPVTTAFQDEQLGTAHAVRVCKDLVHPDEDIMVLYGDCALIKPETIQQLASSFETNKPAMALMTYKVPSYDVYKGAFQAFGRILRDDSGSVFAIREMKDCTDDERAITEINPAFYAFSGKWLWENIHKIEPKNAQSEYYLTDLLEMAINAGQKVHSIQGERLEEAIGINTIEQLRFAEQLLNDTV